MNNIRNFCIIAHIDHGKSTLSDRLLEMTGTVEKRKMKEQLLDQMDLERERGITIKLQPVRMEYETNQSSAFSFPDKSGNSSKPSFSQDSKFILNLIDTPGHVDFGYEVSRSLAAVEGAVLLVDATKGVQAQTLANLYQAIENNLEIIPVVNKIDLPNADVAKTKKEIMHILGCSEEDILEVSGKTGEGVDKLLEKIVKVIPPPRGDAQKPLRALIFDSKYDTYKGVLAYVRIVDGEIKAEEKITMIVGKIDSDVIEVGYFKPNLVKTDKLIAGDIGYIATGLKSVEHCRVGDTITTIKSEAKALSGYKEVQPMVYASFYPIEGNDYNLMRDALEKLKLNDAAFTFEPESSQALGRGFRCGFLGLLHLEIIQARMEREFQITPTITTPSVVYEIKIKNRNEIHPVKSPTDGRGAAAPQFNRVKKIYSPSDFPDPSTIDEILEPYVKLDIMAPAGYLGAIMEVMRNTRAQYLDTEYIDGDRMVLKFSCPLTDVITNLHDDIKSASSGYASLNYEVIGYRPYDLVKLDIMVAGELVEAFSRIIPRENAYEEGKRTVEKLKDAIHKQNFQISLQAAIGGKIIARETIKAFRKDVIANLYGGDVSRKKKLLEKQKKGKKKMKSIGKVDIPGEAFLAVLKK